MKLASDRLLKKVIINRSPDSHKGDYGRLLLIGGTYPYGGAIIMAALAAVRSGKIFPPSMLICQRLWPLICGSKSD